MAEQEAPTKTPAPKKPTKNREPRTIDKRRVVIAIVFLGLFVGVMLFFGKDNISSFVANLSKKGNVAGERVEIHKPKFGQSSAGFQQQIDEIKKNVTQLKPEDITEQGPVEKILEDLDDLKVKATESAEVLDVKGNLCEELKRRFCQ